MQSKIELKFSKDHDADGIGIVNSMQSYHYSVDRPDSILFRASVFDNYIVTSNIDRKIYSLPDIYQMPMGYSLDSGKHAVPAKHAIAFLDFLIALTMEHADLLYIRKSELTALLSSLVENKHLTPTEASEYSKRIPVVYDREDMESDAQTNRDADLALKLAQLYEKERETSAQLYWLNRAKLFNSSHPFFADAKNITKSLEGIESANIRSLLQEGDSASWLLDAIAACPTFKRLYFGVFFNPNCINKTFEEFLTKSPSISELHMGSTWSADLNMRMTPKHALVLANALRLNKSIELLDVSDQRICDEGLTSIVDALIANPETKLKALNIFCCGITDLGATYLLEKIDSIPSLRFVNLRYNPDCSKSIMSAIDLALEKREATKASVSSVVESDLNTAPHARTSSNVVNVGMFSPEINRGENATLSKEDKPNSYVI
ncbi:MAG: hypothetical protein WC627_02635 [Legionella sp.]|jgi:hypothetical protein